MVEGDDAVGVCGDGGGAEECGLGAQEAGELVGEDVFLEGAAGRFDHRGDGVDEGEVGVLGNLAGGGVVGVEADAAEGKCLGGVGVVL